MLALRVTILYRNKMCEVIALLKLSREKKNEVS